MDFKDSCELCYGNRGFHKRARGQLKGKIELELKLAKRELEQLTGLFKEVLWYNFKIASAVWSGPLRETNSRAQLRLHGFRLTEHLNNGHHSCTVEHPLWWTGRVSDAPCCPHALLYRDLCDAEEAVRFLEDRLDDAYLYAPGGAKYEELRKSTLVGVQISNQ